MMDNWHSGRKFPLKDRLLEAWLAVKKNRNLWVSMVVNAACRQPCFEQLGPDTDRNWIVRLAGKAQ